MGGWTKGSLKIFKLLIILLKHLNDEPCWLIKFLLLTEKHVNCSKNAIVNCNSDYLVITVNIEAECLNLS